MQSSEVRLGDILKESFEIRYGFLYATRFLKLNVKLIPKSNGKSIT